MKEYTVYELEAGDKLYHVTGDNKIEEITLTKGHFVEKFDDSFYCYSSHNKSYAVITKNNKNYYINQPKLRSKNEHVPIYSLHCESLGRDRRIYLTEEEDIKVYATRQPAEKEIAKRELTKAKNKFFATIHKAEIYDAISNRKLFESEQVKSISDFNKFKNKVKELEEGGAVLAKIETLDGNIFTVEEIENNLKSKIAKLTNK